MRLAWWTLALLIVCASPAFARDAHCPACEKEFPLHEAVFWGAKTFCSDKCKDDFWAKSQDRQYRCKVCDEKVRDPSKPVEGKDAVAAAAMTKWDGLCASCRKDHIRSETKGGDSISASSHIEKSDDGRAPAPAKRRRVVLPAAEIDSGGGVPMVSWILIGVLGALVGLRQYQRKSASGASARGK